MNSHIPLFAILTLCLFFMTACAQNTIVAEAPNESIVQQVTAEQPCANVQCGQNQVCKNGACVCAQQFKTCKDTCTPSSACCTDTDCGQARFCGADAKCHRSPRVCDYNQAWNATSESCACVESTKFCSQQNRCIPSSNCCVASDCTLRRNWCVPTSYFASVCVKDPLSHCKGIIEGQEGSFSLANGSFKVQLVNILGNGRTDLKINDEPKTFMLATPVNIDDQTTLFVEAIKSVGGVCKTINERNNP